VKTGDIVRAGTNSNVYLQLYGTDGETSQIALRSPTGSTHKNKFERGNIDKFILEVGEIGKLERMILGHDGKGVGSGWYVDELEIYDPEGGIKYKFSLRRWLDVNEGDRQLQVEAYPTQVIECDKLIPYEVTVTTGDVRSAGTDADVFIQMYGKDNKTEQIVLNNRSDNFERGKVEKFKVLLADVGEIPLKLRVGHNGKGAGAGWFLDRIVVQRKTEAKVSEGKRPTSAKNSRPGSSKSLKRNASTVSELSKIDTYHFICNRWLAKSEDDGQIVRELVPTDENGNPFPGQLTERSYLVKVFTGKKSGAGTDADVFVNMTGENGDSGEIIMDKSKTNINKFERNSEDQFEMKCLDLGRLKKLRVRLGDSSVFGIGDAWFLDRIEVTGTEDTVFVCNNWLGKGESDGQTERVLVPMSKSEYVELESRVGGDKRRSSAIRDSKLLETRALQTLYKVNVKTGDVRGAGTDANVHLIMFGENDDSGKIMLKDNTDNAKRNKFERKSLDIFTVEAVDIGDVKKIKIGHDGAGIGDGWYVEFVEIECPSEGWRKKFPAGRWLDKSEDDGMLECELIPDVAGMEEYVPKVAYEFSVFTSDLRSAGTDSDLFIRLYGTDGVRSEQLSLCRDKTERKKRFERAAKDVFVLEMEDIGPTIEKNEDRS